MQQITSPIDEERIREWMTQRLAAELAVAANAIDIHQSFTRLGLDSIVLVGLTGELAEWLDKELPAAMFWEYDTIAAASEHLSSLLKHSTCLPKTDTPTSTLVQAIQPHGDRPALYLVHGLSGLLSEYYHLVKYLDSEQPVYGLHAPPEPYTDIEEMAACYVAELRIQQPDGPYYLGGYCFGAVVAYEMAQQLSRAGQKVALLALMDARPPNTRLNQPAEWLRSVPEFIANVMHFTPYCLLDLKRHPQEFVRRLGNYAKKVRRSLLRQSLPVEEKPKRRMDDIVKGVQGDIDELQRHHDINVRALVNYVPSTYQGRIVLFKTYATTWLRCDPAWLWRKLANGGIESRIVPGSHLSMMAEPYIKAVAEQLKICLMQTREQEKPTCSGTLLKVTAT